MEKIYLVTGAAGHLASALLRLLVPTGARVRGLLLPQETAPEIGSVVFYRGDVTKPETLEPFFENPDGCEITVFHLAGLISIESEPTPLLYRVNVEGTLFWGAHWLNGRTERPGQFVLLSSLLARWPDADCPAYSASKAATAMAFRALRLRHAGESTRFKIVYLGPVHTSINPRFVAQGAPPRGVAAPEAVARHLANVVLPKPRSVFYYPWMTGLVCRFGAWMPDGLFERLTRPLRR